MIQEFPLIYQARHLLKGKKRANLSTIREDWLVEIPELTSQEAPLAITLVIPTLDKAELVIDDVQWNRDERIKAEPNLFEYLPTIDQETVDYRIAPFKDGTWGLVAKALGPAFQTALHNNPYDGEIGLHRIPRFKGDGKSNAEYNGQYGLGAVIATDRDAAIDKMNIASSRAAFIEGELWLEASPPGWGLMKVHRGYRRGVESQDWIRYPMPDPLERLRNWRLLNPDVLFFNAGAAEAEHVNFGKLEFEYWSTRKFGDVVEVIPGILDSDWQWRELRHAALRCVENISDLNMGDMITADIVLLDQFKTVVQNWPPTRDKNLVELVVKAARTVHGIRTNDNADMLALALCAANQVNNSKPTESVEEKLQRYFRQQELEQGLDFKP